MLPKFDNKWNYFDYILAFSFILIVTKFIWAQRFLPLQDYPDWLYQGYIFSEILKGNMTSNYHIIYYPVPNSISTLIIGIFNYFLNPEASGKLFLTLSLINFIFGSVYLINSLDKKEFSFLCYIPFIYSLNYFFLQGYLNYFFSIGILFLAVGYLLRRKERADLKSIWIILGFSFIAFWSHAITYSIWVAFLAIFLIFNYSKSLLKIIFIGLAPSIIMLALYILYRADTGIDMQFFYHLEDGISLIRFLKHRLFHLYSSFCIFQQFYPFIDNVGDQINWMAIINICSGFIMFIVVLYWIKGLFDNRSRDKYLLIFILIPIIGVLFAPRHFAGSGFPAHRFVYPAIWTILCALAPNIKNKIDFKIAKRTI